jgi:hypothetical protein
VILEAVEDYTAATVTRVFMNQVCAVFGPPDVVVSDNGPAFDSELDKATFATTGVRRILTTPYRPEANSRIERVFKTLGPMLASLSDKFSDRWAEMLPHMAHAYNTSYHRSIDEVPFYLMFGRDAQYFDFHIDNKINDQTETVRETFNQVSQARALIKDKLALERYKNKKYYDSVVAKFYKNRNFEVGHLVWVSAKTPETNAPKTPRNPKGQIQKLAKKFVGPYRIVEIKGYVASVVPIALPACKPLLAHFNRIKPCLDDATIGDDDPALLLAPFGADPALDEEAED